MLLRAAGCYAPEPQLGGACGPSGECPSGQVCDPGSSRCVTPGTLRDAAPPDVADAVRDGPAIDADPSIGCADGEREAFVDRGVFPAIAGCAATWPAERSLRADAAAPCGDDLATCGTPASACATGWHLCARSGAVSELQGVTAQQCREAAATGRFVAAISHCASTTECVYAPVRPCLDSGFCSEPVCCGAGCSTGAGCPDGVYAGATLIHNDVGFGCNALTSSDGDGVLCCAD
jgi:hypothetical protein